MPFTLELKPDMRRKGRVCIMSTVVGENSTSQTAIDLTGCYFPQKSDKPITG